MMSWRFVKKPVLLQGHYTIQSAKQWRNKTVSAQTDLSQFSSLKRGFSWTEFQACLHGIVK